jgi:hypothetical protein
VQLAFKTGGVLRFILVKLGAAARSPAPTSDEAHESSASLSGGSFKRLAN